jgi:hypothetical protein
MSFMQKTRRNHANSTTATTALMQSSSETLETRQLLSGNAVTAPDAVVDSAIEDHASAAARNAVNNAESAATTAAANANAEQTVLENRQQQATTENQAKETAAKDAQQKADEAQAEADEARETQSEHEQKAQDARDAQQDAYDRIEGPAVLDDGSGDKTPLNELSEEQLREKRRNANVYLHNSDLNNTDGEFTAREEWGREGKNAEIHDIDAELARRDAEAKQALADKAQQEADAARDCADQTRADWEQKIADQQTKADQAQQAATTAQADADAARDAAVTDAENNLDNKIKKSEEDVKRAKEQLLQKLRDIRKALYFARLLGLTPDSFTADKLQAWQDQMDELIKWVDEADNHGLLPETMADVIKIATEAIVGVVTGLRNIRLQQMEFEVQGIDLGNERNGMSNGTAGDWMQDDKHGANAAGDIKEARRIMRILLDWNKHGIDISGCVAQLREQLAAAEARLEQLKCDKSALSDATTQLRAAALDESMNLEKMSGGYWNDWSGMNEKWIRSDDGWLFILPNGSVRRWQGGRYDEMRSTAVGELDVRYYNNPSLLHESDAVRLDQELELRFTGSYHSNWGGQNEKWMLGRTNWFWVNDAGELFRWDRGDTGSLLDNSTLVADGLEDFWANPEQLHDAASLLDW